MAGSKRAIERFAWEKLAEYMLPHFLEASGDVFWVDSGVTTPGNGTFYSPYSTVAAAVSAATASNGDVIVCKPGHAETITAAGGVTLSKAGLNLVGLGRGRQRPTFTFTTATTATLLVSAADCLIKNIVCTSTLANLGAFVNATANGLIMEDCELYHTTNAGALSFINLTTTYDNFTIRRCKFSNAVDPDGTHAAASTGCIYVVDSENITIEDCTMIGNFETAIVHNKTTKCQNLIIKNCYMDCVLADCVPLILEADATGAMINSFARVPAATDIAVANIVGTIGNHFWLARTTCFGNDSGGGQLAAFGDAEAS